MHELPRAEGYLLDLDGTLIGGQALLPRARGLLDAAAGRFAILSNDAEHTPDQLGRMLRRLGVRLPVERIVLAGTAALDEVAASHPGGRVMVLASAALRGYARRRGLQPVEERPDVVVLGRDRRFTYAKLAAAANAVCAGAELVVANPDGRHPGPNGEAVPETGALLAAVLACAGPVPFRVIGKPEPSLFLRSLALLGIAARDAVMVGDNPETDGLGARRLGMRFHQVGDSPLAAPADRPRQQAGLRASRHG